MRNVIVNIWRDRYLVSGGPEVEAYWLMRRGMVDVSSKLMQQVQGPNEQNFWLIITELLRTKR